MPQFKQEHVAFAVIIRKCSAKMQNVQIKCLSLAPHRWGPVSLYRSRRVGAFTTLPERVLTSFSGVGLHSASMMTDFSVN